VAKFFAFCSILQSCFSSSRSFINVFVIVIVFAFVIVVIFFIQNGAKLASATMTASATPGQCGALLRAYSGNMGLIDPRVTFMSDCHA
jgi:hypothetical protein